MAITREYHSKFTELYKGYPHERAARNWLSKNLFTRNKHKNVLGLIDPQKGDYILECGSSSGKLSIDCALRGARVIGIDLDPNAIEVSRVLARLFPEVKDKVSFILGDLTEMSLPKDITKVLFIDFTEHVPDNLLVKILNNIKRYISRFKLYIYTPNRMHIFEYLRSQNFVLKENKTHIALRTMTDYKKILQNTGFNIIEEFYAPSHVIGLNLLEKILSYSPFFGKYFRRRICITAEYISNKNKVSFYR